MLVMVMVALAMKTCSLAGFVGDRVTRFFTLRFTDYDGISGYCITIKYSWIKYDFFGNSFPMFKFLFVHIPYMQSLQWSRGIDSRGHRPQNCRIMDPFELLWSLLTKRALSFALNVQWISAGNWLRCIHKIVSSPPPPQCDIDFRINPFQQHFVVFQSVFAAFQWFPTKDTFPLLLCLSHWSTRRHNHRR